MGATSLPNSTSNVSHAKLTAAILKLSRPSAAFHLTPPEGLLLVFCAWSRDHYYLLLGDFLAGDRHLTAQFGARLMALEMGDRSHSDHVKRSQSYASFISNLKTQLFSTAFPTVGPW